MFKNIGGNIFEDVEFMVSTTGEKNTNKGGLMIHFLAIAMTLNLYKTVFHTGIICRTQFLGIAKHMKIFLTLISSLL